MSMTRSQRFAVRAMREIAALRARMQAQSASGKPEQAKTLARDYLTRARGFPALVMQSGLVQATGFLLAKSQSGGDTDGKRAAPDRHDAPGKHDAYAAYAASLARVLGYADAAALHAQAVGGDAPGDAHRQTDYRQLTRDVLHAASHLRRYAQIELKPEAAPVDAGGGDR